ncbi:hypothetical protein GCM10027277_01450 [Pseudoduganella ginsengisoli]|uniref:Uncharacterized protein n=1 Tax=Pseudoduganella ginsengisoli TaxID=1462440 RepID=A0A6L6Q8Y4_9BURK|nr:hypothetical protein [Pseudoduganella ginsengisoli]MTW06095.1 hypothetical protein [Pseudoduganella ginsengisoli]
MHNLAQPIANEFDSYMQDRAQRLGYQTRFLSADRVTPLPPSGCYALVEFSDPATRAPLLAEPGINRYRERGHFTAWADQAGGLVQINGTIGARTFAEEFFGDTPRRSLPLPEFNAYVDWFAAATASHEAQLLTLAISAPDARALMLVRTPSASAAAAWLQRCS